jgi:hypothetical protein
MKYPSALSYAYRTQRRKPMPGYPPVTRGPLPALLMMALLAGCATVTDVEKAKRSWQGATYDEVVARWGQPASQSEAENGLQTYDWISERGGGGGGSSVGAYGGSGGAGVGVSMPLPGFGMAPPGRCQRSLSFKDGRVVDQLWQGSTNYCSIFGRE